MTPKKDSSITVCPTSASSSQQEEVSSASTPDTQKTPNIDIDASQGPLIYSLGGLGNQSIPIVLSPPSSPHGPKYEDEQLVRRNSLSLLNRTPPPNSLAAEILGSTSSRVPPENVPRQPGQMLLSSLKNISESLSDFNSCLSYSSSNDASDTDTMQLPVKWLKKRKRKESPEKEDDKGLKKADLRVSPDKTT